MKTNLVLFCALSMVIVGLMVSEAYRYHEFWKGKSYPVESIQEYGPGGFEPNELPFRIRKIPFNDSDPDEFKGLSDYSPGDSIKETRSEFGNITAGSLKVKIMMFRVTLSYGKVKTPLSELEEEINEWLSGAGRDFEIINQTVSPTGHDGEVLVVYHYLSVDVPKVEGVESHSTSSLNEIPNDPFKDWKP